VQAAFGDAFEVTAAPMMSQIGSGALPADRLPSFGLRVGKARATRASLNRLEAALRELPRPVIGRIADQGAVARPALPGGGRGIRRSTAQWSVFGR
jgi:L-seryl-tRNA(Ser) seleniumtransferase